MFDLLDNRLSRRGLLKVGALAAGASLLSACAPKEEAVKEEEQPTAAEEEPAEEAAPEQVTVTYWDVSSPESLDGEVKAAMIDRFEERNADIKVDDVYKPTTEGTQMSETLLTAIAGGNPPDAAYFDRFIVAAWAAEDSLTDLTDLCDASGISKEDYFDFAWIEVSGWQNKVWALPFDTDDRALYYNNELVAEAGLDPDTPPADLDEVDEWAAKLFKFEGPRMLQAGFIPWYNQGGCPYVWGWLFDGKYWDAETNVISVNDPPIVESMEWRLKYAEEYGAEKFESFSSAFGSDAQNPFYMDQVAMFYGGDWELANIAKYAPDLDFTVVPMPWPANGRMATMAGGWSVVVPRGAAHVEEGFRFISDFAGPEEMDYFCHQTSHIPTLKAAAEKDHYYEDPNHAIFMDMLPIANTRPPVPIGQFLWTALIEARDLVIHGESTPQEALDKVNENGTKEMERYT